MAVLIPALGSVTGRMTPGERRLAERLERKLDADYLLWYDVPIGPKQAHPDFVVLHPSRGLLVLEVKDWRIDTLRRANRNDWTIAPDGIPVTVPNPLEQARQYAHQVADALKHDAQLVEQEGRHQGRLCLPWSYGVVFPNIRRQQFEAASLDQAIDSHRVICQDEMVESVDAEDLQSRLWGMFSSAWLMHGALSLPQIDRVRWILFPEVRVPQQGGLFDAPADDAIAEVELPDIMHVMDLQQEQLARSLGDGHRVIHGVAGSGKTMILGYRAEYLAKTVTTKPVLVLCYNRALADKLDAQFCARGLASKVHARGFHQWCRQQLVTFGQAVPQGWGDTVFRQQVDGVIRAMERGFIPAGQYQAVLIDEGHDFKPEWLKLVTQMVDPKTNSLLVLYDDAQSIYERQRKRQFSFKSVGIQAQGRTTILRINYRNTRQILQIASLVAADLLTPEDKDDDGVPLLRPVSCGRDGDAPLIVRLPTLQEETRHIAALLLDAHQEGHAWSDMAVLCRRHDVMDVCAEALRFREVPHQVRHRSGGGFDAGADAVKVMTMHASKGLEFPVVALPGAGLMPEDGEDPREEAKVFYVAATRATQRLIVTVSGDGVFGKLLTAAPADRGVAASC